VASTLSDGQQLRRIVNRLENGECYLVLQPNGNLEVKRGSTVVWQTYTGTDDPSRRAEFARLESGNLRLRTVANETVWQTNTPGGGPYAFLQLANDGNLLIHHPRGIVWWSLYRPAEPLLVEVPNVRENLISYARYEIEQADLVAEFFGDCSGIGSDHGEAWVESQRPNGGERVEPGTTVRCTCNSGPMP
jgi:hypothetical protein